MRFGIATVSIYDMVITCPVGSHGECRYECENQLSASVGFSHMVPQIK